MNHLKEFLKNKVGFMLTYADTNAKGFFKKQGFSETILLEKKMWKHYIKDYENATLRCCQLLPQVNYRDVRSLVGRQREAVYRLAASRSHHATVYTLPQEPISNPLDIPGVKEANWTEEAISINSRPGNDFQDRLKKLLMEVWDHSDSWAFHEPVDITKEKNYLQVIKKPMGRRRDVSL